MHIHTVKGGDTVFKIARAYTTSPMKIIENNAIENPDLLTVGEELLILTPTRTYTVRGADTLAKIARRFGVKRNTLLANNPYLCGEDRTYPGEILAIKYDAPTLGTIAANGYCFMGYDRERLLRALPYLTYLTVGCAATRGGRLDFTFDDGEALRLGKEAGKIMLMRVYDKSEDIYSGELIDEIIKTAKGRGYDGITLSLSSGQLKDAGHAAAFLLEMRKRMLGSDLILINEINKATPSEICDLCDANVFIYDKGCSNNIPTFEEGERATYLSFAEFSESAKTFIDLPSFAYSEEEAMEINEAKRLARRRRCEIETDERTLMQSFEYTKFSGGHAKRCRVVYDSLKNTKAKLELVGELGFMGVSFDTSRISVAALMMMQTMFSHQEAYLSKYDSLQ